MLFHAVEHFYDFLGSIVLGKIVSGTVIEQVTQENELVRLFDFKALKQLSAAGGGAVDIGSEHKFHNFSVPFFFLCALV